MLYRLTRPLLFKLPPERAHQLALTTLHTAATLRLLSNTPITQPCEVMGLSFPNRVGIAAGLDKNADHLDALAALGSGFIEVGTITPRPQPGNPRPRLFRLPAAKALINRLGFNNQGLEHALARLSTPAGPYRRRTQTVIGANIGKNKTTPLANAVDDYLRGLNALYSHVDYLTINISSPNTAGLRELQHGAALNQLLAALKSRQAELAEQHQRYVPLAVKIAPDLSPEALDQIASTLLEHSIDAVIATNTTLDHSAVAHLPDGAQSGGLSGAPLTAAATVVVKQLHNRLGQRLPIIAAGGIMSVADAQARINAGACLLQLYTGLIYRGPKLIREIAQALS